MEFPMEVVLEAVKSAEFVVKLAAFAVKIAAALLELVEEAKALLKVKRARHRRHTL